jgi:serine/threonine-protein kinase RsbW
MTEIPNVRLTLSNRTESVLIVRQMLVALAELLQLNGPALNDIITAATEACNNVVLHAYGEEEGPLEVEVCIHAQRLAVVVRDRGAGMDLRGRSYTHASHGIGLSVIEALAASSEVLEDGGVEVRMSFATPGVRPLEAPMDHAPALLREIARRELEATVAIEATPAPLALALLPRVLGVLAAQAHFSVAAISDVRRVADGLVASAAECTSEPYVGAAATITHRQLRMRWGPLPRGAAEELLERTALAETAVLAIPVAQPVLAAGPSELLMVGVQQQV